MFKKLLFLIIFSLLITNSAIANIGVGINNGKIVINDKLKPGQIYKLPSLTVFNTGTEVTQYGVSIQYNEKQQQLKPNNTWFHFSPDKFTLPANGAQKVDITLEIPFTTAPGDYFAYIDAHPVLSTLKGVTSVGIAAGSKLYFTIIPANAFTAAYFRIITIITSFAPWSYILILLIIILISTVIIKKKVKININVEKKQ